MSGVGNMPAFPSQPLGSDGMPETSAWEGMTLRDWFAGQAILVTANRPHNHGLSAVQIGSEMHPKLAAKAAYAMADAMLAARTKGGES